MPQQLTKAVLDAIIDRASKRIIRARLELIVRPQYVFWSVGALNLTPVPVPFMFAMPGINSPMATDATHLLYDPIWIDSNAWSNEELQFVIAHEVAHCLFGHPWRMGNREPQRANMAMDYAVNPLIGDTGLPMPKGGLLNDDWRNMAFEEIYPLLPEQPTAEGDGSGNCGNCGSVIDPSQSPVGNAGDKGKGTHPQSAAAEPISEDRWDMIARQSAYLAKAQGKLPGGLEHLLEPKKVKLDPRTLLRNFIQTAKRDQYSWQRPNRRHLYRGLYMPSLVGESLDTILMAIDVSGSVSNTDVAKCLGFVNSVLMELRPATTWLLQCDAAITSTQQFRSGQSLPRSVNIKGRGGTCMRPIWEWAADRRLRPTCAIVLSDMEMTRNDFGPAGGPGYPVMWISTTPSAKAPFGRTIDLGD